MAKYNKMTETKYNAIKLILEGGASYAEAAKYMQVSEATVGRVKSSESFEEYNAMMTDAQDALGDLGFDLWGNAAGETRKAATRSSLGASQDSIDESNARLTAIQSHTYSMMEDVKNLRVQNESLSLITNQILAEVMGIHVDTTNAGLMMEEMMGYIKDVRLGVNTIVDKGVTIL